MSMTDPIADLLTRIRNANMRGKEFLLVPFSKTKLAIVKVLVQEGFVREFCRVESSAFAQIKIFLKYYGSDSMIRAIVRVSKPGLRQYVKAREIKPVMNSQGISIVSTSNGILSDRECRQKNLGGELVCKVW